MNWIELIKILIYISKIHLEFVCMCVCVLPRNLKTTSLICLKFCTIIDSIPTDVLSYFTIHNSKYFFINWFLGAKNFKIFWKNERNGEHDIWYQWFKGFEINNLFYSNMFSFDTFPWADRRNDVINQIIKSRWITRRCPGNDNIIKNNGIGKIRILCNNVHQNNKTVITDIEP